LVDDYPSDAKERFLGIDHEQTIAIRPYAYETMDEFIEDDELLKVLPEIESKLQITPQTPSEDRFSMGLEQALSESVLDWPRESLAPDVWVKGNRFYTLRPELRQRILTDIERIPEQLRETVVMIGSICTYNYNDTSDLDVHIVPPEDISQQEIEQWQDYAKRISGRLVGEHPINYYLHDPGQGYYADSIYDIVGNRWIKWAPIQKVDLKDYYEKFREVIDAVDLSKAELYRDIIDLEELRDAYEKASPRVRDDIEREIESKIDEINEEIDLYMTTYRSIKDRRKEALGQDFPSSGQMSNLPANVIFLMIRRYGYGELAKALKELRREKEEISSPADMEKIKRAF
jgi:hypothetical protein